jgi:hypothetical protein
LLVWDIHALCSSAMPAFVAGNTVAEMIEYKVAAVSMSKTIPDPKISKHARQVVFPQCNMDNKKYAMVSIA